MLHFVTYVHSYIHMYGADDIVVSIATALRDGCFGVRILAGSRDFSPQCSNRL
jgi:hypothetical protein